MAALAYSPAEQQFATLQEYWEVEQNSQIRHEYINGRIEAMAGASANHNRISGNVFALLHAQLRGHSCEPFSQDLRVRMPQGHYVYPDVVVACPPLEWDDELPDTLANPRVIIEVLSPSTAALDRGEKFDNYLHLSSLTDYILISQNRRHIEHYQRREDGDWLYRMIETDEDTLAIESIGCHLTLTEVYERVEFSSAQPANPPDASAENSRAT